MGTAERTRNKDGKDRRDPFTRCLAPATLLFSTVLSGTQAQGAVPFSSGHNDGSSSMVPLLVIVLLAYCAQRVAARAVVREARRNAGAGSPERN